MVPLPGIAVNLADQSAGGHTSVEPLRQADEWQD
jgi:hypothetical protein